MWIRAMSIYIRNEMEDILHKPLISKYWLSTKSVSGSR